ncbi:MAG TPA: hypothetical protein VHO69_03565 [Phototrophicaceae bacterium]|nr:hypothetical protein [Phototrophicaceae bacterium]
MKKQTFSLPQIGFSLTWIGFVLLARCSAFDAPYRRVSDLALTATPDFVIDVSFVSGNYPSDELCIEISQEKLWEAGNEANELSQHLSQKSHITVDGQVVPQDDIVAWVWATIHFEYDETGTYSGSYGGEISFCFEIGFVAPGTHTAVFETQTMSGKPYSYTWGFDVVASSAPNPTPSLPTPFLLPTLTPTK